MVLFGVVTGPVGWLLRRLVFPQAGFLDHPLAAVWVGLVKLMVQAVLMGVVFGTLSFFVWPHVRKDLGLSAVDVESVTAWHERRWGERGVYLLVALAGVLISMLFSLNPPESFSGPPAALFLYVLTVVPMMLLALLCGAVLRVAWADRAARPESAASAEGLE